LLQKGVCSVAIALTPPAILQGEMSAVVQRLAASPSGVSSLVSQCLERIKALEPEFACMVHLDEAGARQRAAELDGLAADKAAALPLYGLPVIVKEIFSVDGMPDSSGSVLATPELFAGEGSFIKKLRAAGCVILGKSLSTEFALSHYNTSRVMPVNPADLLHKRATGGSSSGSAAAMAADYCSFAVGTDTGGSVRCPAALCGVVGFKPTAGVWDCDGIFPLAAKLDTPGLFTRSVADAAYIYAALQVESEASASLSSGSLSSDSPSSGMRIGVPQNYFMDDLDTEVRDAFTMATDKILAAGHELVPITFPDMRPVADYFAADVPMELLGVLGRERVEQNLEVLDPFTRQRLEVIIRQADHISQQNELASLTIEVEHMFEGAEISGWIAPTVPCVAPLQSELQAHDALTEWQARISRNTRCINALGMTAISLPLPTAALPVGLQLATGGGKEQEIFKLAKRLVQILGA
jgi:aspartyl-tRNA(Asn)/glutamyl-tRNA(Gln) amidotransferase subunit A